MSQLRIAHYIESMDLHDGGVVRAVLDLSEALVSVGHRVTVMTLNDKDIPATWHRGEAFASDSAPGCIRLGARGAGGHIGHAAIAEAERVLRHADVAHMHAMWVLSTDQVSRAAARVGTPYIWSPHGMLDDWCMQQSAARKRVYHALIARRSLTRAAALHCTAEAELDQAGKWFGPARRRGVVIPLPFDLADYRDLPGPAAARARFGLDASLPTLLYLSRLHPKKGVGTLIRSVSRLREQGRSVRLVVAGGGDAAYERELKSLVQELSLGEQVMFPGFVKGREKVSLYQAADAFVLPSSQENFGYVVVEAMAAGTPVITTRGVALWPQLEREKTAVLVEPEVEPLAQAIRGVLDDPAAARAMAARGRAWCLRELDPSRIIASFVEMYQRAAATASRPRVPAQGASHP